MHMDGAVEERMSSCAGAAALVERGPPRRVSSPRHPRPLHKFLHKGLRGRGGVVPRDILGIEEGGRGRNQHEFLVQRMGGPPLFSQMRGR